MSDDPKEPFIRVDTSPDFKRRVGRIAEFINEKLVGTGERTDVCLTAMMHVVARQAVGEGMPQDEWMLACKLVYEGYRTEMN